MGAIQRNIPNFITCLNLLCGCLGILAIQDRRYEFAVYLMIVAAVFDVLDGFLARILKAESKIGKDLDSLADVVTFGVLPGYMMFHMLDQGWSLVYKQKHSIPHSLVEYIFQIPLPAFVAFLIPIFAALRLAKFNNDDEQKRDFHGLPTPAMALTVGSIYFMFANWRATNLFFDVSKTFFAQFWWVLVPVTLGLCTLMNSNLRLMGFKNLNTDFKANKFKLIFIGLALAALVSFKIAAIPIITVLYILLSIIHFRLNKDEIQS